MRQNKINLREKNMKNFKEIDLETIYKNQTTSIIKNDNGKYKLNSKFKIGKVVLLNQIAMLNLSNSSQKIYIEFDKLNGAYDEDIVIVQIAFNPKGKTKAKVIQILESNGREILCYKKEDKILTVKENISIPKLKLDIENGDIFVLKNNKIKELFGNVSDPKVDQKISLYLGDKYDRLESIKYKIQNVINNKSSYTNRIDLSDLAFCTIDPSSAKDHDDAIYFDEEKSELYVAIADVSAFVKEGSDLDLDAKKKGFSIYFPHKVMPMLPFELSTDLCSLVPNKKRFAYVFKMKLDLKNISVESSELFEAVIESKNKYSYEQIDDILEQNDTSNEFVKFYNITKQFRKKRLKNGYDFRSDEIRLILNSHELLEKVKVEFSTPSHSLVEECMLLANQEAAKRLKTKGIFRVHDEPSANKIKKLVDEVNLLGIKAKLKNDVHSTIVSIQQKAKNVGLEQEVDELIIQAQQQAHYGSIKKPHFGLGFSDYSHFTSPIRRYSDLVLHRILKSSKIPDDLEDTCTNISDVEREIASLVWDFEDRKYARYLSNHIGDVYMVTLIDVENHIGKLDGQIKGARVYLENYSGEKLFSSLQVRIVSSDIVSKKIVATVI
jgi:ribonuclease R